MKVFGEFAVGFLKLPCCGLFHRLCIYKPIALKHLERLQGSHMSRPSASPYAKSLGDDLEPLDTLVMLLSLSSEIQEPY